MTDIERKTIDGFEIKDADRGEVVAVVSTMNVVDRDGDVVLQGAIRDGAVVKLSAYGHDVITEGKPPVGRGVISIEGDRAIMKGRYFMSTDRGRDAFNTVKEMGADSEWSIGFAKSVKTSPLTSEWKAKGASRLISEMQLFESSPVFMGANAQTGTVSAKGATLEPDPPVEETPAETPAEEPAPETLDGIRDALKSAREQVATLEAKEANLMAVDIFARFQRNFNA
jgi:hypothetical protein